MRSRLSLLVVGGIAWILVGLPTSVVRAAPPVSFYSECVPVASATFSEAVASLSDFCAGINPVPPEEGRLIVTMCISGTAAGGLTVTCPENCDPSGDWHLACSVVPFRGP